jgi:hypothetical protein
MLKTLFHIARINSLFFLNKLHPRNRLSSHPEGTLPDSNRSHKMLESGL